MLAHCLLTLQGCFILHFLQVRNLSLGVACNLNVPPRIKCDVSPLKPGHPTILLSWFYGIECAGQLQRAPGVLEFRGGRSPTNWGFQKAFI